jgi:hypothetical protein
MGHSEVVDGHVYATLNNSALASTRTPLVISVTRTVTGNVKRWRDGGMILRWTAAGVLEAEKRFRRVNGYRDLQLLRAALERSCRRPTWPVGVTY